MTCKQDANSVWTCDDMTDAWQLKKDLDVSCFTSITTIEGIKDVDCNKQTTEVEVNQGGERFWLLVLDCPECTYILGRIITDLILPHPYAKDDLMQVEVKEVYKVRRTNNK